MALKKKKGKKTIYYLPLPDRQRAYWTTDFKKRACKKVDRAKVQQVKSLMRDIFKKLLRWIMFNRSGRADTEPDGFKEAPFLKPQGRQDAGLSRSVAPHVHRGSLVV